MSLAVYTTTSDVFPRGDYGAKNNTCLLRCMVAAITNGKIFDDKAFSHYMSIFEHIARRNKLEFPKIGEDIDVFEVSSLLNKIANQFHFCLEVVQCDDLSNLVFHDIGVRIGDTNNKNKFFLCLYGRHFYLHKIHNLAPIDEEQMIAIQIASQFEDFEQVNKLQSEFLQSHQAKLAKLAKLAK
jgi:hypothetical protein